MRESMVALLTVLAVLIAPGFVPAQSAVPRITYLNPVAGISIEIPEDWEMGTNDWGSLFIGLDADISPGNPRFAPQLWFFYCQETPEQMVSLLRQHVPQLGGSITSARPTGNGDEWEVCYTSNGGAGRLSERWLCRTERGQHYVIAAMCKPELEAAAKPDLDAAQATCRLIGGPRMKRFAEPSERAYRMLMPADWHCDAKVVRDLQVPGYFEWKALSPDGACGAFSGKPTVFNITIPYTPARLAAKQFILPALQQQIPGLRLDRIQDLSRQSAHYRRLIQQVGLGDRPLVDKTRADYVGIVNGVEVRLRVTVATMQLDQSQILGGRGAWTLFASGAWAPQGQFDALYPLGRGVVASLATDPDWKDKQFGTVGDVTVDRAWLRDAAMWCWDVILTRMN